MTDHHARWIDFRGEGDEAAVTGAFDVHGVPARSDGRSRGLCGRQFTEKYDMVKLTAHPDDAQQPRKQHQERVAGRELTVRADVVEQGNRHVQRYEPGHRANEPEREIMDVKDDDSFPTFPCPRVGIAQSRLHDTPRPLENAPENAEREVPELGLAQKVHCSLSPSGSRPRNLMFAANGPRMIGRALSACTVVDSMFTSHL